MPQTKLAEKPVMLREQILSLIVAITDRHDLCLLYIGVFCDHVQARCSAFSRPLGTANRCCRSGRPTRASFIRAGPRRTEQGADLRAGASPPVIDAWKAISTLGKNFLKWRIRPINSEAGYSRSPRHLPGDAADAGDRHAASWNAQGHARHTSACQHPYDGRYLCSEGARRVYRAGEKHGPSRTQYQASSSNSAKFGEAGGEGTCKLLILWLLR